MVDGIENYKSTKVTEYEVLSNDGISGHYEQRCQNRITLLEKLRTTDGIELILESEDERRFYRSEAHRFNFRTICL